MDPRGVKPKMELDTGAPFTVAGRQNEPDNIEVLEEGQELKKSSCENAWFCDQPKHSWLVATQIFFIFTLILGEWSNLTNIFKMGWNHQPDSIGTGLLDT